MYVFVVTSRGILVEEIPEPGNRRRFGNPYISMINSIEMICDQHPAGFNIDYLIYSILVTVIRGHPREVKINQETLIWLCGNMSVPCTGGVLDILDWIQVGHWSSTLEVVSLEFGNHQYIFDICRGIDKKYVQVAGYIEASQ